MTAEEIAELLRHVRAESNLKQAEVARRLDLGYNTIGAWEAGHNVLQIVKFLEYLDICGYQVTITRQRPH